MPEYCTHVRWAIHHAASVETIVVCLLQASLIKFNKFLQDNDSKRSRAEKKEREQTKQRHLKEEVRLSLPILPGHVTLPDLS